MNYFIDPKTVAPNHAGLLEAERAWRAAVAKYNAAQSAAIAAKPDDGARTAYYDPNDEIHRPVTEAGQECSRTYKVVQELRKSLGLLEL